MVGKRIFKYTCFIFAFLISFHHTVFANIPQHTNHFYVNDFANVLTQETINHINQKSRFLDDKTGAQLVVSIVDFTDGIDIDKYAMDMFNQWGIGDPVQNNGILLLLVIGEEDYFAATGDGIDNIITDAQLDRLLMSYLEPNFALGNYDLGVLQAYNAIFSVLEGFYNVSFENYIPYNATNNATSPSNAPLQNTATQPTNTNNNSFFSYLYLLIIFIFIVPFFLGGGRRGRRGRGLRRSSLFWWLMPSPFSLNRRNRNIRNNTNNTNNTYTTSQPKSKYTGNSTAFGRGGRSSGGVGRGGNRLGGGGRSSGGGVGRRR